MKILTKRQQHQILAKLAATYLMMCDKDRFMQNIDRFAENTADIAYLVGGSTGMFEVNRTLTKHE